MNVLFLSLFSSPIKLGEIDEKTENYHNESLKDYLVSTSVEIIVLLLAALLNMGGFISDIFDGLNALQYGVTGMIKGKGFYEGVKTRQSFSDKDALGEHGIPGMIGGIALDIAVDPLTYIPPLAIAKRLGLVGKIKKMMGVAKETREAYGEPWFYLA